VDLNEELLAIKALMVDVDGVLVDGRPEDGRHWQASIADDLGVDADMLHQHFFVPYWDDIVLGRVGLMEHLTAALQNIAPHVDPAAFIAYWFERDSRLVTPLLRELSSARSSWTI
jgi:putative hydrolase of the HAD superfamily